MPLLFIPFAALYTIPNFLNLTQLQVSLYYSLAWYPSLGIGFLLVGIFAEAKDEMLVTKSLTNAGTLMLASSIAFVPVSKLVTDYYRVIALGLIATSIMLLIYLGVFLVTFSERVKRFLKHDRVRRRLIQSQKICDNDHSIFIQKSHEGGFGKGYWNLMG